jgi:hypothetical protein
MCLRPVTGGWMEKMISFHMMLNQLHTSLQSQWIDHVKDSTVRNIVMALPDTEPEEGCLYIGNEERLLPLLERWKGNFPLMFIQAEGGDIGPLEPLAAKGNSLWAVSSLSTMEIGNRLMSYYFQWERQVSEINDAIVRGDGISQILKLFSTLLQKPMFWLDAEGRVLASEVEYAFENRYIMDLLIHGEMPEELVAQIRRHATRIEGKPQPEISAMHFVLDHLTYGILCEMRKQRMKVGRILILSESGEVDHLLLDNFQSLLPLFRQYASLQKAGRHPEDSGFSLLLDDIFERRLHSEEELNRRAEKAGLKPGQWYQWILAVPMDPGNDITMDTALMQAIRVVFPGAKVSARENRILILNSRESYREIRAEEDKLVPLAQEYDARFCIGSFSRDLFFIRQAYLQSCAELNIAAKLHPEQRVILGERYQIYHIIDLCFRNSGGYHEGNLLFLCSPRYAELLRYDQRNSGELSRTLAAYLQNSCNATRTAKALYVHRNTLLGRLNRIEELLGGSLDDDNLRMTCAFSAAVATYIEKYLGKDPLKLSYLWAEAAR